MARAGLEDGSCDSRKTPEPSEGSQAGRLSIREGCQVIRGRGVSEELLSAEHSGGGMLGRGHKEQVESGKALGCHTWSARKVIIATQRIKG